MFDRNWKWGHEYIYRKLNGEVIRVPVTILDYTLQSAYPFIAIWHYTHGDMTRQIDTTGLVLWPGNDGFRIVNKPAPKKQMTRYLNVYNNICTGYLTEQDAKALAGAAARAIAVPVTFEIDEE